MSTSRYTDTWLAEAGRGEHGKGYEHSACILARLTPEQRDMAIGDAHRLMNRVPMRFSQAVHDAANAILDGGRLNLS